jgi:hypothetical protein
MNTYDLVPENTEQYPAYWHEEQELVYIELDDDPTIYGSSD